VLSNAPAQHNLYTAPHISNTPLTPAVLYLHPITRQPAGRRHATMDFLTPPSDLACGLLALLAVAATLGLVRLVARVREIGS